MREATGGRWWSSPRVAGAAAVAPAVLGLIIVIHQLTLHWVLRGVTFSADGVNFGSALALTQGRFPYNNYALGQPPGMTILLLPFAWAAHATSTQGSFEVARVVTALVAAFDVFLVGYLARERGLASSLTAGVLFALYPLAFHSTASVMLGPYLLFFSLLGIIAAFHEGQLTASGSRLITAGALLGFAMTIKPWAALPALGLLACACTRWRTALPRVLGAMATAVAVPCLIFFLASPGSFWADVVSGELGSTSGAHVGTISERLAAIFGFSAPIGFRHGTTIAVIALATLVVLLAISLARLWRIFTMLDWFVVGVGLAVIAVSLAPRVLPVEYGYFAAAFLAILIGNVAGHVLSALSGAAFQGNFGAVVAAGLSAVAAAALIVLVTVGVPREARYEQAYFLKVGTNPAAAVDRIVPSRGCAVSNHESTLIVANRALGVPSDCPIVLDPSLDADWSQWLAQSHFLVISADGSAVAWTPAAHHTFADDFIRAAAAKRTLVFVSKSTALP